MKLLGTLTSPYVRKARIVLAEKKIDYDFVINSPWEPGNTVSLHNPLGKVPLLLLDDESSLYDSRVIVEYLDTVSPNNRLIPASGRERITVKRWEALGDGVCDAAAAEFVESKRSKLQKSEEWIRRQRSKIVAGLKVMSDELGEQQWCHGNAFSLADIAIGSALGYLLLRFPGIDWRATHPNLEKLYAKLMQRPSFVETVPQG
ncbi:MAG: glutathione S-transferase [Rhodocyclaceae bacterium]|nr:MAG: glutathione S-transferase [Rhodocyclaceae bacterium]